MINRKQDPLRKLARSAKFQNLYIRARELASIHIFDNASDFSKIQLEFLYWIALYNRLYQDLAIGEKYLSEEVIDDDLLCDCYLVWEDKIKRKEELEKIKNPYKTTDFKSSGKIDRGSALPSVVFRKG